MLALFLRPYLPFPFFASLVGPKIFDAMLLRTERGVDGKLPPKMSLLPPPGGFRTLKEQEEKEINKKITSFVKM